MYNTVSLEVAKKLKDTGWESHTYFEYDLPGYAGADYYPDPRINYPIKQSYIRPKPVLPAPQLHEILEVLEIHYNLGVPTVGKCNGGDEYNAYFIHWRSVWGEHKFHHLLDNNTVPMCLSENPHDAAAKLLIWCVKNNYITL